MQASSFTFTATTASLLFPVLLLLLAGSVGSETSPTTSEVRPPLRLNATHRAGKALSVFQIVTFPNDPCDAGSKNGTCYTAAECSQKGGSNSGTCADGFGVCCIITLNCGGQSSENCTYFDSSGTTAGGCSVTICPCNGNICQLRLDFTSFTIAGPTTATATVGKISAEGVQNAGGTSVTAKTQCLTDTFSVTNGAGGNNPPSICGVNTGEHMYADMTRGSCTNLAFIFGNTGVGTSIPTRAFSIKATQYSCNFANLAPSGCTQYFYGGTTGNVRTYNYQSGSGQALANQDQNICIRRERGSCRICWYAAIVTDFDTSGTANAIIIRNSHSVCCSYVGANIIKGYDCLNIPGAQKSIAPISMVRSNYCGQNAGLATIAATPADATAAAAAMKSICSTSTPFMIAFRSDSWEYTGEAPAINAGFTLGYTQDAINC